MLDWTQLKEKCIWQLARDIARPRIANAGTWMEHTEAAIPEATEKLKAMDNLELLDLIGQVVSCNA